MIPVNKEAYKLFHDGTLIFADIEASGIRIDIEYCKKASLDLEKNIRLLEKKINNFSIVKEWKKLFGNKFNLNSNVQLKKILFDHLGIPPIKVTAKGNNSVDDEALSEINIPLTKFLLKLRSWKKIKSTYLESIIREETNGFIHPFFGLIGTRTYRGQSDHPNFQNLPIRDPVLGKIIRQAIIPRRGNRLVERDYKGIEISVAQSYNQDPTLLYDIEHGDMHRDAAMKCFSLRKEQMTKSIRYAGKNMFVFPQFYGDWYKSNAKAQWGTVRDKTYALPGGTLLIDHLQSKGIMDLEDLENHLEKVEDWFWNKKYTVYSKWKKEWLKQYWRQGYFETLTGFRCHGLMDSKQAVNYPIQGSAFHCLLWSLIQMNKFLKKYKFKSCLIAQIHDCSLSDEDPKEEKDISERFEEIMTIDLKKHYPWITAPMIIETEKTEINGNWWEKK